MCFLLLIITESNRPVAQRLEQTPYKGKTMVRLHPGLLCVNGLRICLVVEKRKANTMSKFTISKKTVRTTQKLIPQSIKEQLMPGEAALFKKIVDYVEKHGFYYFNIGELESQGCDVEVVITDLKNFYYRPMSQAFSTLSKTGSKDDTVRFSRSEFGNFSLYRYFDQKQLDDMCDSIISWLEIRGNHEIWKDFPAASTLITRLRKKLRGTSINWLESTEQCAIFKHDEYRSTEDAYSNNDWLSYFDGTLKVNA